MATAVKSPATEKEFEEYYHLRWKILRKPWGQPVGSEKDDLEEKSFHLIAVENGSVIGCCRVQMNNDEEAQLRYMAVDKKKQKKGVGKLLLKEAEEIAREAGARVMLLESREKAVDFYKKNGYLTIRKSYILFDEIQHYTMSRSLL